MCANEQQSEGVTPADTYELMYIKLWKVQQFLKHAEKIELALRFVTSQSSFIPAISSSSAVPQRHSLK